MNKVKPVRNKHLVCYNETDLAKPVIICECCKTTIKHKVNSKKQQEVVEECSNCIKQCDQRKQVIQNCEDNLPNTIVNTCCGTSSADKAHETIKEIEKSVPAPLTSEVNYPKKNSTKCWQNKMKRVQEIKPTKIKSTANLPPMVKTTVDEKLTKVMNVPFDKKLYKELVSLNLSEKRSNLNTFSTTHIPHVKDKVPKLEDFFVPCKKPEYSISSHPILGSTTSLKNYNGMRLHQVITTWKLNLPD